jgi:hypothetical protein
VYIRYFARTDDSDLGLAALAYCDLLVATGLPVLLVTTRYADLHPQSGWSRHGRLVLTPMTGVCVNAVCGDVSDWHRCYTPGMRNLLLLASAHWTPAASAAAITSAIDLYGEAFALDTTAARSLEFATGRVLPIATAASIGLTP